MRITFLLPFLELAGSIIAALEYADQLARRGHTVRVVYAAPDSQRETLRAARRVMTRQAVPWHPLHVPLRRIPAIADEYLPEADVTVAVDWTTARDLAPCGPRAGKPVFFVQGYDIFNAPEQEVHAAWRLPMPKLVISTWLKEVAEGMGVCAWGPLVYGVDQQQFYGSPRLRSSAHHIGMLSHPHPNKGFADGLLAFEMARKKFPSIRLVLFGAEPAGNPVPGAEFHLHPVGRALREVYTSCDIWLVPSWTEGGGMVGMEALACGCALVTTDVGAVRDYCRPGVGALVSPPRDANALAENLVRLLGDPHLRLKLAEAGQAGIRPFTWERSAAQMEAFLARALEPPEDANG